MSGNSQRFCLESREDPQRQHDMGRSTYSSGGRNSGWFLTRAQAHQLLDVSIEGEGLCHCCKRTGELVTSQNLGAAVSHSQNSKVREMVDETHMKPCRGHRRFWGHHPAAFTLVIDEAWDCFLRRRHGTAESTQPEDLY